MAGIRSGRQEQAVMETSIAADAHILVEKETGRTMYFSLEEKERVAVWLSRCVLNHDQTKFVSLDISLDHMGSDWIFHSVHIPPEKKVVLPIEVAREVWRVVCSHKEWSLYRA
jgi:hypothetical protein